MWSTSKHIVWDHSANNNWSEQVTTYIQMMVRTITQIVLMTVCNDKCQPSALVFGRGQSYHSVHNHSLRRHHLCRTWTIVSEMNTRAHWPNSKFHTGHVHILSGWLFSLRTCNTLLKWPGIDCGSVYISTGWLLYETRVSCGFALEGLCGFSQLV